MKISKRFVQRFVANDCEARNWSWVDTEESYESLVEKLASKNDPWFNAVAIVEKTFDDETFTITEKVIKMTQRTYTGAYHQHWSGVEEKIFEE